MRKGIADRREEWRGWNREKQRKMKETELRRTYEVGCNESSESSALV